MPKIRFKIKIRRGTLGASRGDRLDPGYKNGSGEAEARNAARPTRKEKSGSPRGTSRISEGLSEISKSRSAAPDMVRSRQAAALGSRIAGEGKTAERFFDLVSIDGSLSYELTGERLPMMHDASWLHIYPRARNERGRQLAASSLRPYFRKPGAYTDAPGLPVVGPPFPMNTRPGA